MVSNETQHNASLFFDLDDPATLPTYNCLPKWLQEKIAKRRSGARYVAGIKASLKVSCGRPA